MAAYTIVHRDDCEQAGQWSLVRRSLEVNSFGINLVEIPPGESIPEHDETDRDQEEVFFVVSGRPTVVVNDEEIDAPEGTFVRVDVMARRTVRNHEDSGPASVLIVSAPQSSGYEPMGWA
jgi:mannose-6-phosphate isomerase-like protein (cupin superfamily)